MAGGAGGADAGSTDTLNLLTSRYERHYRELVRLSALLTGDRTAAETIASDCLLAQHHARDLSGRDTEASPYLLQQAVLRSRRARAARMLSNDNAPDSSRRPGTAAFTGLPVVRALSALRQAEREAVVLAIYLGLPEQQVAAVLGLGISKLRRNLAAGAATLQAHLQGLHIADPAGQG